MATANKIGLSLIHICTRNLKMQEEHSAQYRCTFFSEFRQIHFYIVNIIHIFLPKNILWLVIYPSEILFLPIISKNTSSILN